MEEEIYFLSPDAVVGLWLAHRTATGRMDAQLADEFWLNYQRGVSQLVEWATSKERLRDVITWLPTIGDANTLRTLILEVGVSGTLYYKMYGGKMHVIFRGRAGLRQHLTAPKYGVDNSKVIKFVIGRRGVRSAVVAGSVITIFLLTGYRFLEFELSDGLMMSQLNLTTGIAADLAMIVGSGVLTYALGALAVTVFSRVIGPLVVVIGVSVLINLADSYLGLGEKLQAALSAALIADAQQTIDRARQQMDRGASGLDLGPGFIPIPRR